MKFSTTALFKLFAFLVLSGLFFSAKANEKLSFEIEVDPIAYMLKGYSLHGIYILEQTKIDLGIFGLELPSTSPNKEFTVTFKGFGFKYDYFGNSIEGFFTGIQASMAWVDVSLNNSSAEASRTVYNLGIRSGYRWSWGHFFVSPWMSVDYNILPEDNINLEGKKYEHQPFTIFPTVHLGYSF